MVVELGLDLIPAAGLWVLGALRGPAEAGLQFRLAAVGHMGQPPCQAQPGVRAGGTRSSPGGTPSREKGCLSAGRGR